MRKEKPCSPITQAVIDAAESGNAFAQYLLESKDYYAEKVKKHHREQLKQSLHYTKHSKCKKRIERKLRELRKLNEKETA